MSSRVVRWFGIAVPVVALAFGGWAFAQEPQKKDEPKKPEVKVEKKEEKKVEKKDGKDIVAVAMDSKDPKFTTFCDLLKDAGLVEELKKEGLVEKAEEHILEYGG